ncbi:MAG TPA: hypothetical protein ENI51_01035 [Candidatus Atribacteria bacterium]|nr:hypothetical protein [Candidatus Atribacteria bacterium]
MNDEELILLCALRYALGRRSYIVGVVSNYIRKKMENLSFVAIGNIIDEITKAEKENGLGSKIDKEEWLNLRRTLNEYYHN